MFKTVKSLKILVRILKTPFFAIKSNDGQFFYLYVKTVSATGAAQNGFKGIRIFEKILESEKSNFFKFDENVTP